MTDDEIMTNDDLTLKEIEQFLYVCFYRDEKNKCRMQKCNLNNKRYLCNTQRMKTLSIILPHGLNKVELKKKFYSWLWCICKTKHIRRRTNNFLSSRYC